MTRPEALDRLRSSKKPRNFTLRLLLDPDLVDELARVETEQERATEALEEARSSAPSGKGARTSAADRKAAADAETRLAEVDAQLAELRETIDEQTITFRFQSVGRRRYEGLLNAHPPPKSKLDEAEAEWERDRESAIMAGKNPPPFQPPMFDEETFPAALVAASLVDPDIDEQAVRELWDSDDWSGPELTQLYMAALAVNTRIPAANLGKGSSTTRN